jgi:hypothetical protein
MSVVYKQILKLFLQFLNKTDIIQKSFAFLINHNEYFMCTLNLYSLDTLKKYYSRMMTFYFTAGPKSNAAEALYQSGAPHFVSSPHLTNSVPIKHDRHSSCAQKVLMCSDRMVIKSERL